ncbi:MAG: Hsp20/alpha crystallin family protein [Actinobacteria bacterium]|nr:MAG: Hsp20/alpha crystallin family protein [Actinomycetota bacterium]
MSAWTSQSRLRAGQRARKRESANGNAGRTGSSGPCLNPSHPGYALTVEKRRDIEHAAEEIEQLFADLWQVFPFSRGLRRGYRPQVDVFRSEEPPLLTVQIELAGVDPDDVQLVASPQALLIAGERRRPKDCGHYQQMEMDYGPFQRQITLDEDIDPEDAVATYERGILTVRLPIAPRPAPRESVSIAVRRS